MLGTEEHFLYPRDGRVGQDSGSRRSSSRETAVSCPSGKSEENRAKQTELLEWESSSTSHCNPGAAGPQPSNEWTSRGIPSEPFYWTLHSPWLVYTVSHFFLSKLTGSRRHFLKKIYVCVLEPRVYSSYVLLPPFKFHLLLYNCCWTSDIHHQEKKGLYFSSGCALTLLCCYVEFNKSKTHQESYNVQLSTPEDQTLYTTASVVWFCKETIHQSEKGLFLWSCQSCLLILRSDEAQYDGAGSRCEYDSARTVATTDLHHVTPLKWASISC